MKQILRAKTAIVGIHRNLLVCDRIYCELLNDNKTWRITLEFDNLLSVERINFLTSSIRKYLQEEIGTEECKFSVIYRNSILDGLNNILIAEYFEEAIRVLSTVKREITIIRKYPFELVTNEIMISVGTEMEKAVVDAQCKLIKKFFNNYGLIEIEFFVEISDDGTDFKAEHEKELQILENHNIAIGEENYKRMQLDAVSNTTGNTYNGFYKNNIAGPHEQLLYHCRETDVNHGRKRFFVRFESKLKLQFQETVSSYNDC